MGWGAYALLWLLLIPATDQFGVMAGIVMFLCLLAAAPALVVWSVVSAMKRRKVRAAHQRWDYEQQMRAWAQSQQPVQLNVFITESAEPERRRPRFVPSTRMPV